jgi:hypothetical protein
VKGLVHVKVTADTSSYWYPLAGQEEKPYIVKNCSNSCRR